MGGNQSVLIWIGVAVSNRSFIGSFDMSVTGSRRNYGASDLYEMQVSGDGGVFINHQNVS